jgi:hypothetical protein
MVQVVPQVMSSQRRAWEVYAVAHYESSPVHRRLFDLTVSKANGTLASNSSLFRRPSYQSTTNNTYGQRNNQTNATRVSVSVPPPLLRLTFDNGLANRIFTWDSGWNASKDGCDEVSLPVPETEDNHTDYYGTCQPDRYRRMFRDCRLLTPYASLRSCAATAAATAPMWQSWPQVRRDDYNLINYNLLSSVWHRTAIVRTYTLHRPCHHDESSLVVTYCPTTQWYHDCDKSLVVHTALHYRITQPIVACALSGRIRTIQRHGTRVGFLLGYQCQTATPRGRHARAVQLDQFLGPSSAVVAATFGTAFVVVVVDQCDVGHGDELWRFGIGGHVDLVRTDALCRLGQCTRPDSRVSNGMCACARLECLLWTLITNTSQTMWFPIAQQRSTTLASLVNNGSNHELDGLELDSECSYAFRLQPGVSIRPPNRRNKPIADSIAVAILVGILFLAGCLLVRNGLTLY